MQEEEREIVILVIPLQQELFTLSRVVTKRSVPTVDTVYRQVEAYGTDACGNERSRSRRLILTEPRRRRGSFGHVRQYGSSLRCRLRLVFLHQGLAWRRSRSSCCQWLEGKGYLTPSPSALQYCCWFGVRKGIRLWKTVLQQSSGRRLDDQYSRTFYERLWVSEMLRTFYLPGSVKLCTL